MTAGSGDAPAVSVEIAWEDARWRDIGFDLEEVARQAAGMALAAAGTPPGAWSVSLLAADAARSAELNEAFRGKPAPTNVLSWPAFDLSAAARGAPAGSRPAHPTPLDAPDALEEGTSLGDVALSYETVLAEAAEQGLTPRAHATHLIMHGVLHLLGYDHETEADAALMEGLESEALAAAGFADPYGAERASEPR